MIAKQFHILESSASSSLQLSGDVVLQLWFECSYTKVFCDYLRFWTVFFFFKLSNDWLCQVEIAFHRWSSHLHTTSKLDRNSSRGIHSITKFYFRLKLSERLLTIRQTLVFRWLSSSNRKCCELTRSWRRETIRRNRRTWLLWKFAPRR